MSTQTAKEENSCVAQDHQRVLAEAKQALSRVFTAPGLSDFKRLELAKKLNLSLQHAEFVSGRQRLDSLPSLIELPVAGKCNLRCTMCSLSHGAPTYPNWTISEVRVFESLFRYAHGINPTGVGEPLAVRDLPEMLKLFRQYGLVSGFYTNGTLLTAEKIDAILDAGVFQLNVSLDGATKETYERIRRHGSFHQVLDNLRLFMARRKARGTDGPRLQIAMVLMLDNIDELPAMVRLAHELEADSVYTMYESGALKDKRCQLEPERTNMRVEEARELASSLGLSFIAPAPLPKLGEDAKATNRIEGSCNCILPWRQFLVHNDRQVGPCCQIKGEIDGHSFGSLNDDTPEALWNSPGMVHLRERLSKGDAPEVCRRCHIRTLTH